MDETYTNYNKKGKITFDVVIDEVLHNLLDIEVNPNNKALLSLANDFESGAWRKDKFEKFVWNNIKETALSAEERKACIDEEQTIITNSAKNLRLDRDKKGGEIGEIVLYGIMKKYYGALSIVPKIFYKQSSNDYTKGSDSIHITLNSEKSFLLWLGEAKFYDNIDNALPDAITSIKNMLDENKLRKEFSIVTALKDLDSQVTDEDLVKKIKDKLSDGISLDEIKEHLHIPIMILHECNITKNNTTKFEEYKKLIKEEHIQKAKDFIRKQDENLKNIYNYKDIKFHLILFPIPDKSELVERFYSKAKMNRGE